MLSIACDKKRNNKALHIGNKSRWLALLGTLVVGHSLGKKQLVSAGSLRLTKLPQRSIPGNYRYWLIIIIE